MASGRRLPDRPLAKRAQALVELIGGRPPEGLGHGPVKLLAGAPDPLMDRYALPRAVGVHGVPYSVHSPGSFIIQFDELPIGQLDRPDRSSVQVAAGLSRQSEEC